MFFTAKRDTCTGNSASLQSRVQTSNASYFGRTLDRATPKKNGVRGRRKSDEKRTADALSRQDELRPTTSCLILPLADGLFTGFRLATGCDLSDENGPAAALLLGYISI